MGTGTAAGSQAVLRYLRRALRFRARFALYLAVFILPLAAGTWAFARYTGDGVQQRGDSRLHETLRSALERYAADVRFAEAHGADLARSREVQRALLEADRPTLRRIARDHPNTAFYARGRLLAGSVPPRSTIRSVEVVAGDQRLGRIVAALPLNADLLAGLRSQAGMQAGDVLLLAGERGTIAGWARGEPLPALAGDRPEDVRFAGRAYRAVALPLLEGVDGVRLVVLTPKEAIEQAAAHAQERVLLAGGIVIAAFGLIGYALAPAIARGRFSQQQRAQAARVLSRVGDGVLLVDGDGVVRLWNPAAEAITGLAAEAVRGRYAGDAIPGWAAVARRIGVGERRVEAVPLELGSRELWLSVSGVESPEGTIYTFRDLTEERRLEKAKIDFVSTVSHELRTPVASIYGAAMTLRARVPGVESELGSQLLDLITDQSDRLTRLVEQILLAGRLDSGLVKLDRRSFDPSGLVRTVVDAHRTGLPAQVALDLLEPAAIPEVVGDPDQARQVLSNLIENAVKYSPQGGKVEIVVAPAHRSVRVSVRDQGLGIPASEQERIFEKFYRLDPDMTRGIGGSGLGLYICRELVRRMNGRIWVTSRVGIGSTFSFELPTPQA